MVYIGFQLDQPFLINHPSDQNSYIKEDPTRISKKPIRDVYLPRHNQDWTEIEKDILRYDNPIQNLIKENVKRNNSRTDLLPTESVFNIIIAKIPLKWKDGLQTDLWLTNRGTIIFKEEKFEEKSFEIINRVLGILNLNEFISSIDHNDLIKINKFCRIPKEIKFITETFVHDQINESNSPDLNTFPRVFQRKIANISVATNDLQASIQPYRPRPSFYYERMLKYTEELNETELIFCDMYKFAFHAEQNKNYRSCILFTILGFEILFKKIEKDRRLNLNDPELPPNYISLKTLLNGNNYCDDISQDLRVAVYNLYQLRKNVAHDGFYPTNMNAIKAIELYRYIVKYLIHKKNNIQSIFTNGIVEFEGSSNTGWNGINQVEYWKNFTL